MGLPCCFVRMSGCPFKCKYCDTAYARLEPGEEVSAQSILQRLADFPSRLVEVTGGEPLAQPGTINLLASLLKAGYSVMLETSGHLPLEGVPADVSIIMDIKTPGSGHVGFHPANLARLGKGDSVKFVICDRQDFDWALDVVAELALTERSAVYFSPARARVAPGDLAAWVLEKGYPIRVQLPLQGILWGDQRGR